MLKMAGNKSYTIVEYFGGDSGYRCGYCKNDEGNFSHGMWSHTMTVQDYQDLIDRGWRRSGKYVYKPKMNKTCCPQYTIRCHALKFQPSKSHKKVLKKISKFISKGELPKGPAEGEPMDSVCDQAGPREPSNACPSQVQRAAITDIQKELPECPAATEARKEAGDGAPADSVTPRKDPESVAGERATAGAPRAGMGADPGRPPCRKAKDLRKERRLQKEQNRPQSEGDASIVSPTPPNPAQTTQPKPLEDFINESLPDNSPHRLEVRLVPVNFEDPQFTASYQQSVALYASYQMAIHGDEPSECSESEFRRFLCDSPLEAHTWTREHWCSLINSGTSVPADMASSREIAFTRQLQKQSPKLSFYYLGFYIHSCPKMRYKGQYRPSDLLCPETYAWVSIEQCIPQLENSRYARFNQDPEAGDARVLKEVGRALVLYRRAVMPYAAYSRKRKGSSDEAEVQQYADLVGQDCAERILLYRA
uniref:Arginyl-tRNA--protein transferase 1 n=1 Tax=Gasterosteus aculeatus aculeatus TaxID=481459 RepID=A0AAQ4P862_GASAC